MMSESKTDTGYIYVIKHENKPVYKIGRTINPKERFNYFGVQLPFFINPIILTLVDNHCFVESRLHHKFKEKRINGEWFKLTDSDIDSVKDFLSTLSVDKPDIEKKISKREGLKTKQIYFRLNKDLYNFLEKHALNTGNTLCGATRFFIDKGLESPKVKEILAKCV